MTLKSFPVKLYEPKVNGFKLEPKIRNTSIRTESGIERLRSVVSGDAHVFTATFTFSEQSQITSFDNFLKYDINYGRDWFEADWNTGIGFPAGTQAFAFADIKEKHIGHAREYTATVIMQPLADAPDPKPDWPTNETDVGFLDQRFACISPSSDVIGVTSASVFDLATGEVGRAKWRVGWVLDLFDLQDGSVVASDKAVQSISNDEITLVSPFSVTPLADLHGIRFSEYDNVVASQKNFGFISDDDNDFPSDGGKAYRIMYG